MTESPCPIPADLTNLAEAELVLRLAIALDYRDEDTGGHIRRISLSAERLALRLGWPAAQATELRLAAPLHDIGKIGLPDRLLGKPDTLTAPERDAMQQHTLIGAGILDHSPQPLVQRARAIALAHHERWDGGGYPHGLHGAAIPAAARVTALVDVYDALKSDRLYREALPEEEALRLIARGAGTQFDPAMTACFLEYIEDFRDIQRAVSPSIFSAFA